MPDTEAAALLRAILDEFGGSIPRDDASSRTHVASKSLEVAKQGKSSVEDLKKADRASLPQTPTMWR
jgi:hypothetical protein